jgi:hypothetical protein
VRLFFLPDAQKMAKVLHILASSSQFLHVFVENIGFTMHEIRMSGDLRVAYIRWSVYKGCPVDMEQRLKARCAPADCFHQRARKLFSSTRLQSSLVYLQSVTGARSIIRSGEKKSVYVIDPTVIIDDVSVKLLKSVSNILTF